jgi:hypothetical protein
MRPQLTPLDHFGQTALARQPEEDEHDDLGWNDMGHDIGDSADDAPSAEIVQLQPEHATQPEPGHKPEPSHKPEIVRQQRNLARRVTAPVAAGPAERHSALADGRRAAFTLRVDSERHLKLRLACTVKGRSAQQLVTEALDKLLEDLPDLADLAERVGKSQR